MAVKNESKRVLNGQSLFIFGKESKLRMICDKIVNFWLFEWFIIVLILISTITLAFEHPLEDPESKNMQTLRKIDIAMTTAFCIEALMKIIASGLIINGSSSYLFDPWNVLDFMIVVFAVISITLEGGGYSFIKVLRVARILRPLRLIRRAEGLKLAIHALFKAIP